MMIGAGRGQSAVAATGATRMRQKGRLEHDMVAANS